MKTKSRSVVPLFLVAVISLVLAVASGAAHLGEPLRLVDLVTVLGLAMTAGATWDQAVRRFQERSGRADAPGREDCDSAEPREDL